MLTVRAHEHELMELGPPFSRFQGDDRRFCDAGVTGRVFSTGRWRCSPTCLSLHRGYQRSIESVNLTVMMDAP